MNKDFYDRKDELGILRDKYRNLKFGELIVIYGRRRVGKTELIKQFMKLVENNKFYFYVDLAEKQGILNSLSLSIQEQLNETVRFLEFDEFLDYIDKKSANQKFVLVIDEFQRFLDIAPDFITKIQNHWDSKLKNNSLMLILVGSSTGMIQKITNSRAGALYGRGAKIKISPFKYADFRKMFLEINEEEKICIYSIFGGTPYYLEKVKKYGNEQHMLIYELLLKKGAELFEEPKTLLEQENVRAHAKYNAILHAASSGKETLKEIQDSTKLSANIMPAYISKLDELLDLIGKNNPILGKERLGRYQIKDNFFRFWYRFIFPNQTALNLGNTKFVSDLIKNDLNSYIGRVFESIIKEFLIFHLNKKIKGLLIDFENIGSWWDRMGNEIDVVAYNERSKNILLGEVKWTLKPMDTDIVEELIRKSKIIEFSGKYSFLFVSKSGFTERCIKRIDELGGCHLDLNELTSLFDKLD